MTRRSNIFAMLLACLCAAALLSACGGDDGGDAVAGGTPIDAEASPEAILDQTFSTDAEVTSADLGVVFDFAVEGEAANDFRAELNGPIDAAGEGLPSFDLDAVLTGGPEGEALDVEVGATSTGDAAFVNYDGTDYEIDELTLGFIENAFEASDQSSEESEAPTGLPQIREFLTDVRDEGTEDVEGTETVHVSGAVDVDALIEQIRPLADQAGALGAAGNVPTPQELDQLGRLVQDATFDVYSGTEDSLLRRLEIDISLAQVGGDGTAQIAFDLTLGEVNEPQEIEAPADAEPFSALTEALDLGGIGALGGLGGLGGDTGGSGAPAPPSGGAAPPPAGATPSPEAAEEYLTCIDDVVTTEDLRACQALLR